jgi:hypothetical protein
MGGGRINADRALGGVPTTTAIDETSAVNDNVVIYPNPFTDKLVIKQSVAQNALQVEWIDMQGKVLGAQWISGTGSAYIYTYDISKGVYLLKITSGNNVSYRRVVKL